MSTVVVKLRTPPSKTWQDEFMNTIVPAIRIVAGVRFRSLSPGDREEALAEAIASGMISFQRLVERGLDPCRFAGRVAQIAVLRVLTGRLVGSPDNSKDVLSRLARTRRGFKVMALDQGVNESGEPWSDLISEDGKATPADVAAARIDIGEWFGRMPHRRRQIAESLAAGYRTEEVAEQFKLSRARVSQLRREFENSWHEFQRDSVEYVAA